jgi:hypothetical protein
MRLDVFVVRCAIASILILRPGASPLEAADLTGTWGLEFEIDKNGALYKAECSFKQEGNRLSGSCLSGFESVVPVRGSVQDADVTFRFTTGSDGGTLVVFDGTLDAKETSLTGTWRFTDPDGNKGDGTFTAVKR